MSQHSDPINELLTTLKQQRDELSLKIHLGATEAQEEWDEATEKLDQLTSEYDPVKKAVSESAENVTESVKLVAEEVMNSFNRIRKSL